jgi:hypothetical protein
MKVELCKLIIFLRTTMQQASYQQLKESLECYFTIDEQEYLFHVLLSWIGDSSKVIFWFNNEEIPAFGNVLSITSNQERWVATLKLELT